MSFGFKYGILIDADLVFDVRFLPNPFYVEKLRPMSGMDAEVQEYVLRSDVAKKIFSASSPTWSTFFCRSTPPRGAMR